MKLSNLNPQQEFILKTLRFNPEMYIEVKNNWPKMYSDGSIIFNINKNTFDNMVTLNLLEEKNEKYTLKN